MELLYRFEGTLGELAPIGPVPGGLRLDIPWEGRLVDGRLAGGRAWGMEYLYQRSDGVGVMDARDTFEVPGGYVHAQARGFVLPPPGLETPPIEAMLAPGWEPPDVRLLIHGFALAHTGVPDLDELNRTLVKIDGWVNNATRELVFEGRALPADLAQPQRSRGALVAG